MNQITHVKMDKEDSSVVGSIYKNSGIFLDLSINNQETDDFKPISRNPSRLKHHRENCFFLRY